MCAQRRAVLADVLRLLDGYLSHPVVRKMTHAEVISILSFIEEKLQRHYDGVDHRSLSGDALTGIISRYINALPPRPANHDRNRTLGAEYDPVLCETRGLLRAMTSVHPSYLNDFDASHILADTEHTLVELLRGLRLAYYSALPPVVPLPPAPAPHGSALLDLVAAVIARGDVDA